MKFDKNDLLLYAISDRSWIGDNTLVSQIEKAIIGGATFLQLREKELDDQTFLAEAKEIKNVCQKYKVPFIINDNVEIAIKTDADGVHVGQKDMEALNARKLIGMNKILGVSVQTVEQAVTAEKKGADYLGVGAVFPTGTKEDAEEVTRKVLSDICNSVNIPVVAIGGINKNNVLELSGTGIYGIAVISAIFASSDIVEASKELKQLTEQMLVDDLANINK
ncbi:thiamine phosphate synthase [Anaeromicropila herbilytica]|uniref:Thiamine-phosphate synthase n=1 Tax=Anaeromicropila herbilytica TaxID=2785025 RepID=A0A7R7ICR6_9FIRM|nr:thiamine phosphate synthase [Anaeromicropila herbilytica]BCN30214.1 thiamine-phosphate synthase [Anaeromicropila herbilytica]